MASAAVLAEAEAQKAAGVPSTPTQVTPSKPNAPPLSAVPQVTVEIPSARYENGKVYLKENPLKKLDKNYCPHCKLPRLKFPLTGANAKPPENLKGDYCTLHPYIQKPGHDIYGNPFPIDQSGKTKKERELIKKQERMEKDNTPGSQDTNEDGTLPNGSTSEANLKRLMAGGKPASYVPWHTCPSCKRSLLITKFAQHLEKCLGIGGRATRNAAAVRLSGMNGSASASVQGSRVGTPQPSQQGSGNGKGGIAEEGDEGENDGPPKKKAKMEKVKKKEKEKEKEKEKDRDEESGNGGEKKKEKPAKEKIILKIGSKAKAAKDGDPSKRLPKGSTSENSKRSRDDGEEVQSTPRKKMKLARENSMQSVTATENGVADSD
jgi:ribonuclease P/MRP protein subunit POP1